MEHFSLTDVGLRRPENQDSYVTITNQYGDFLALVCDGIGGGLAGDVASREAVGYFKRTFSQSGPFDDLRSVKYYLSFHLQKANRQIYDLANKKTEYRGMGTTLVGVYIGSQGVLSINVGDSRLYGFIDDKLFRLSIDHTLANQKLQNGEITYEESLNDESRHALLKAFGVFDYLDCDIHKVRLMDYYLLCSDGLCGYVQDSEIRKIMIRTDISCEEKAVALRDMALMKGGYDNITAVVIKI